MCNSIFVLFLVIGGAFAMGVFDHCDRSMCDTSPLLEAESMAPTEQELKVMCSPMLERFTCSINAIKTCTGKDLQELALSDNATVAPFARILLNLHSLSIEVCDEDSVLHAAYASNVDCFNEMMENPTPKCYKEGMAVFSAYKDSQKLVEEVENPLKESKDSGCLVMAYTFACLSLQLQEKCGEVARATYVEIMKRLQFISFGFGGCTEDQLDELRTSYLDFMEFDEQKKDWFSQVFNTRK